RFVAREEQARGAQSTRQESEEEKEMTTKGRPPDKGGGAKRRGVSDSIGIIGLGIMGSAMAANLAKAGFSVHGYDVLPARRAALKKVGGTPASSIARVARAAEVL